MPERGVGTATCLNWRKTPSSPLLPERMAAKERLHEVASLLATGFLRHWLRKAPDGRENGLDVLRTPSDVCPRPSSEGESA